MKTESSELRERLRLLFPSAPSGRRVFCWKPRVCGWYKSGLARLDRLKGSWKRVCKREKARESEVSILCRQAPKSCADKRPAEYYSTQGVKGRSKEEAKNHWALLWTSTSKQSTKCPNLTSRNVEIAVRGRLTPKNRYILPCSRRARGRSISEGANPSAYYSTFIVVTGSAESACG